MLAALVLASLAIDAAKSAAHFSVSHIWVERVTGNIPILRGSVWVEPGKVIPTSASAVLDATDITTGEPDRDNSLKSPDFFDVKKYPVWTFASTKVIPNGANAFEMDGNLTIHGVTQPERMNVTVTGDTTHPVYHATAQVNRKAFGMSVTRLDPTIGVTVDVTLDIALKQ